MEYAAVTVRVEQLEESDCGDPERELSLEDLIRGTEVVFAATGITAGRPLEGVRYLRGGARTHTGHVDRASCGKIYGHHPRPRARRRAAGLPALTDPQRNQTDDVLRIVYRRGGVLT
jgi:Bacterial fructose-1,6-bisphosphatase, glpX-encoded